MHKFFPTPPLPPTHAQSPMSNNPYVTAVIQATINDPLADTLHISGYQVTEHHLEMLTQVMPQLRDLALNNVGLTEIPNAIYKATNLETLSLEGNPLTTSLTKNTVLNLPKLKTLNLAHCQLQDLSEPCFKHLPNLVNLRLSHNELTLLPENLFENLKTLKNLYLDHNRLYYLYTHFKHPELKLEIIDLSSNKFIKIEPVILFLGQEANCTITLSDNPLCLYSYEECRQFGSLAIHKAQLVMDKIPNQSSIPKLIDYGTSLAGVIKSLNPSVGQHPMWRELEKLEVEPKKPFEATSLAEVLRHLYNESTRDKKLRLNDQTENNIMVLIDELRKAYEKDPQDIPFLKKCSEIAKLATETCEDRITVGYVLLQLACQTQQAQDDNIKAKYQRLESYVHKIIYTIENISILNLGYDSTTQTWVEIPQNTLNFKEDIDQEAYQAYNFALYNEKRLENDQEPLISLPLMDTTEDVLYLLLTTPELKDSGIQIFALDYITSCTLNEYPEYANAIIHYVWSLPDLPHEN